MSTIIGKIPYEEISQKWGIPQVIAGFEPLDMLLAVYMLAKQYVSGEARVENEYFRAVRPEGNKRAVELMNEVFTPVGSPWRGFPEIPKSKMHIKDEEHDAEKRFEDFLVDVDDVHEPEECLCGEVLKGNTRPHECPLFSTVCTPNSPVGPCMVSVEGMCHIEYKYRVV